MVAFLKKLTTGVSSTDIAEFDALPKSGSVRVIALRGPAPMGIGGGEPTVQRASRCLPSLGRLE